MRTLSGLKNRPRRNRASGPPAQESVIGNSQYGLTWFRVRFGLPQLKACTKGEHVLRFEATVHNTRELRCRRGLDNFPEIITRLAGMADRFEVGWRNPEQTRNPNRNPTSRIWRLPRSIREMYV